MNIRQSKSQARLIISTSNTIALAFAFLVSIITFWYPLKYFLGNKITSWIGFPVTILLTVIGVSIGALPFSYISKQRKDKVGFFGKLQKTLDCDERDE